MALDLHIWHAFQIELYPCINLLYRKKLACGELISVMKLLSFPTYFQCQLRVIHQHIENT